MIEIKIRDVSYTTPDELLNLIEYLKRAAEINKIKYQDKVIDSGPSDEQVEAHFLELQDTLENEKLNVPCSDNTTAIGKVFNSELEFINQAQSTPMPSALFGKCPSIPEPELKNRDFSNNAKQPSIEVDSNGLPWDSRIHARTKTKNKDGSWKGLRGVGPKMLDKVQDELKTVQEIPVTPSIPLPPEAPIKDFAAFMTLVTTNITAKNIEKVDVNKVLSQFGIPSIPVVATRPDLIPAIMMALEEIINESL